MKNHPKVMVREFMLTGTGQGDSKKEDALMTEWIKDIAPSDGLRKWYSHDPGKWKEFKSRYFKELISKTSHSLQTA